MPLSHDVFLLFIIYFFRSPLSPSTVVSPCRLAALDTVTRFLSRNLTCTRYARQGFISLEADHDPKLIGCIIARTGETLKTEALVAKNVP